MMSDCMMKDRETPGMRRITMFKSLVLRIGFCLFVLGVLAAALSAPARAENLPAAYRIGQAEAEAAAAAALSQQGVGEVIRASLIALRPAGAPAQSMPLATVFYEGANPASAQISGLVFDKASSRWSGNLLVTAADGSVISAHPVNGKFAEMTRVPVLKRPLRTGEAIATADVETVEIPFSRLRSGVVMDVEKLIGQAPRGSISPGRPIREAELTTLAILRKNALVQMVYTSGALEIITAGQALDAGAKGDVIEVRNVSSKQVVRAVIEDANRVSVMPAESVLSQADAGRSASSTLPSLAGLYEPVN